MSGAGGLDGRSVLAGALAAAMVALPAALLSELVVDDTSALAALLFAVVLLGFAFGGFVAARDAPGAPLSNGAVAALAAYAAIQAIGTVRRLVVDEPVRPAGVVFAALLASLSGMLGAALFTRSAGLRTRR